MLSLPPALRVALAARLAQVPTRRCVILACQKPLAVSSAPLCVKAKRTYATVYSGDPDRPCTEDVRVLPPGNTALGAPSKTSDTAEHHPATATATEATVRHKVSSLEPAVFRKSFALPPGVILRRKHCGGLACAAAERHDQTACLNGEYHHGSKPASTSRKFSTSASSGTQSAVSKASSESNTSTERSVQLADLEFIQRTSSLPKREDYPEAFPTLFVPATVSSAIHNICQQLKHPLNVDVEYKAKEGLSKEMLNRIHPGQVMVHICSLKVEIQDLCSYSAVGEGLNRTFAKQAAWLQLVSSMHLEGTLKELFPPLSPAPKTKPLAEHEDGKQPAEIGGIDQRRLHEEKDAKTEIYNFAASHGLVPIFDTTPVEGTTHRTRRERASNKPTTYYQANIKLAEQAIDVTGSGKDVRTAEIAAAIAFKDEAEKRHGAGSGDATTPTESAFHVLNVGTARQFFEFFKDQRGSITLEMEHETLYGAKQRHKAKLTVNGSPMGQDVIMNTKQDAEAVAFLTAAVEIAKVNPTLLEEFTTVLGQGKGKVLRRLKSVDLQVGFDALECMTKALVESRDAGLSDARQTLGPEMSDSTNEYKYRSTRLPRSAHEEASERLLADQQAFAMDPSTYDLRVKKAALPMSSHSQQVLEMIDANQYSIIIGATGSGKTTQVPQVLFESAINNGKGSSCNIICTQPRRIAATSVAQRVAEERNEALRKTVGYHVRFDAKRPSEPYGITYCTTGILLEQMKHNAEDTLNTASHIVIDEVHERDLNVDFLMIVLKRAIRTRGAQGRPFPKVVLMSATLDPKLFAEYFQQYDGAGVLQPCPMLSVPGRTFPVKEQYLGSIMWQLMDQHGPSVKALIDSDAKSAAYLEAETEFSANRGSTSGAFKARPVIDWKRELRSGFDMEADASGQLEKEEALVPVALIATTIAHICNFSEDGAILAFLPGLEEILAVQKTLQELKPFGVDISDTARFEICLLHSTVPKEQQAEVFQPSPPGRRKIILSTNIAETSVTVPEVKYVVDSGKLRERRYDQTRRITRLQCVWESKSNAKQRAGRAGRVQDGYYYGLFSKERADSLRAVGLPELLRTDLQETCLSIQAQNFGEPIASFLVQAIEPPPQQAIDAAIDNLVAIEALTADEQLTALGRVLSQLPVHPALGKMILLGVIFKCLDPMIVLGAFSEGRSLFVHPLGLREEARQAHRHYGGNSQSDHIAFLTAFIELRALRDQYGLNAAYDRAHERFLHMGTFRLIDQTAKQIQEILKEVGLLEPIATNAPERGIADLDRNAKDYELIRGLLLAGFHPNLGTKTGSDSTVFRTPTEQSVLMHPSSLNAEHKKSTKKTPKGTLFVYSTLSKSADGNTLFMRDSSNVSPLMAALLGGQMRMINGGKLEMDEWLPFFVKAEGGQSPAKLVLEFRKALDRVLNRAFSSLSDIKSGKSGLANDPVTAQFASRVVEILRLASGRHVRASWPT